MKCPETCPGNLSANRHSYKQAMLTRLTGTSKDATICASPVLETVFIVLLLLQSSSLAQTVDVYEAAGDLQYKVFDRYGKPLMVLKFDFQVAVMKENWLFKIKPITPTEGANKIAYWEIAGDGLDTFNLEQFIDKQSFGPSNVASNTNLKVVESKENPLIEAQAQVFPGPVPKTISVPIGTLWLVYAAQAHLKTNSSGYCQQVWNFDDYERRYIATSNKCDWVISSANNFLEKADFYNPGFYITRGRSTGESKRVNAKAPFDTGFIDVKYETIEWTNVNGSAFPHKSLFRRYNPAKNAKSTNDVTIALETLIVTTSIKGLQRNNLMPALVTKSPIQVLDYRHYSLLKRPIIYSVKDVWPTAHAVTKSDTFKRQAAAAVLINSANNNQTKGKRFWINVAYAFVPVLTLFLFLNHIRTRNAKNNEKTTNKV